MPPPGALTSRAHDETRLAQHDRIHARLRGLAVAQLDRARLEEAAVYVQAAAHYAWVNHPAESGPSGFGPELVQSVVRAAVGLRGPVLVR